MPYYHVIVGLKSRHHQGAIENNLIEKDLLNLIVKLYNRDEPFKCGDSVVSRDNISFIRITESEEVLTPRSYFVSPQKTFAELWQLISRQKDVTDKFIKKSPKRRKESPPELGVGLIESANFLGLDTNWSFATCALQLQEVAVTLVAKRKKIKLDKVNVEKVLNKKIENLSFNMQYEAFSRQVKDSFDIEMPILTTHLRKMRTEVLHEGYNPKPEETDSIVSFTIGLLQKLNGISRTT